MAAVPILPASWVLIGLSMQMAAMIIYAAITERRSMFRYTVEGSGEFPLALLVISHAWPAELIDADGMHPKRGDKRKVDVISAIRPDYDAWRDCGWEVTLCRWET